MKQRPILFNAEMVRAILDGRKTQTRRPIKTEAPIQVTDAGRPLFYDKHGRRTKPKCPFGQPGDQLWVRETFRLFNAGDECGCSEFPCGCPNDGDALYFADPKANPNYKPSDDECPWKPSIHMPRWASRITLEITNIRVERVQGITEADCDAEGLVPIQMDMRPVFAELWDSIYGAGAWDRNDWVWVIEFKRIDGATQ